MENRSIKVEATEAFIKAVNPSITEDFGCELTYDDVGKMMVLNTVAQGNRRYSWQIADLYKTTPNIEYASDPLMYGSGLVAKYLTDILEKCRILNERVPIEGCVGESQC